MSTNIDRYVHVPHWLILSSWAVAETVLEPIMVINVWSLFILPQSIVYLLWILITLATFFPSMKPDIQESIQKCMKKTDRLFLRHCIPIHVDPYKLNPSMKFWSQQVHFVPYDGDSSKWHKTHFWIQPFEVQLPFSSMVSKWKSLKFRLIIFVFLVLLL